MMSLASETKRLVAQFEYTDEDVNIGVKEFLRQIGRPRHPGRTSTLFRPVLSQPLYFAAVLLIP